MTSSNDKPPTNPNATLLNLQQPEKLSKILEEDKRDCLSCRLVGQLYLGLTTRKRIRAEQDHRSRRIHGTWCLHLHFWKESTISAATQVSEESWDIGRLKSQDGWHWSTSIRIRGHGIISASQLKVGKREMHNNSDRTATLRWGLPQALTT